MPDYNGGSGQTLYTGLGGTGEKQSLLRFDFSSPTAVTLSSFSARESSKNPAIFIGLGMIGALALVGGGLYLARGKLRLV